MYHQRNYCKIIISKFDLCRVLLSSKAQDSNIKISGIDYAVDEFTNITPKILSYLGRNLLHHPSHPLCHLHKRITHFFHKRFVTSRGNPKFSVHDQLSPIVTTLQNFDSLCIPENHASRQKKDNYYLNNNYLLRAHMTAHQADLIKMGLDSFLYAGDVYRRDEIDSSHFPVFHQMDGVRLFLPKEIISGEENLSNYSVLPKSDQEGNSKNKLDIVSCDLLESLTDLAYDIFGRDAELRWVDASFPFTHPSWELEVKCSVKSLVDGKEYSANCEKHKERWMELLGCGIIKEEILNNCGARDKIGWAFGLGLERWAMKLYDIPDIRLFWSQDSRFLDQFKFDDLDHTIKFKSFSLQPALYNDISFWLPVDKAFHINDFYELVRNIGINLVEQVSLIDEFVHPKTKLTSHTYRITYRSWERPLNQEEASVLHKKIGHCAAKELKVNLRI